MSIIVGITGRARAGKNTAATGIMQSCASHGLYARVYEISNYVLLEAIDRGILPEDSRRDFIGEEGIKKLVDLGLRIRETGPYYWINKLMKDVSRDNPEVAILPNIRFLNEAEAIRVAGNPGKIIRVKTLVRDGVEYISPDRDPNDLMETENYLIEADYFLTVKRGPWQAELMKYQASALFDHILKGTYN